LVDVVKYEQPELEEQRDQLVVQLSDFKKQKADLEAKILKLVAESGEDILDDEELIVTLDQSKQTSITINKKVEEAEKTAVIINDAREQYRSVAIRGSVLYFTISDIGIINEMYQYSLEFFSRLFNRRLDKSAKSKELEERVAILLDDITEAFYNNICRGLFERHKLLYAYLNGTSILRRADRIEAKEWAIYMRGSSTDFTAQENPVDFISDAIWMKVLGLEEAHANFADISKSLQNPSDAAIWREILSSE
jgi:dynein heavy chain